MRFLRRSLVGLFLMSVTLALFAGAGQLIYAALQERWADDGGGRPQRERVFAVNVLSVEPQTLSPEIVTFGEVQSVRQLEIRTAAGGEIVWLADGFEEGGRVEQGDLIARIDAEDARGRRDTAMTDLSEAEADLRDANRMLGLANDELDSLIGQAELRSRALARQRDLLSRGVGTEAAVETAELALQTSQQAVVSRRQAVAQAETRIDQAETARERRRIALAEAERRLRETDIRAPFTGVLGSVSGSVGAQLSPNERIAQLIDPDDLEVSFRLSTAQYARLLDEDRRIVSATITASIDVDGLDLVTRGKVLRESPLVAEGQSGRAIFAGLDSASGFQPGDFVTVRITEPPLNGVARLPATAVDAAGTVLVVAEGDRLESVETRILRREGDDVIVAAGDIRGREVVAERTPLLGAGIKVKPIRPSDGSDAPEAPEMVALDAERRAQLIAFVEASKRMPQAAKDRVLAQLQQDLVPARMIERLESRMGG